MNDSKKPYDGGEAFPVSGQNPGMSLRDWFAGQAAIGLLIRGHDPKEIALLAGHSYTIAEALIRERDRGEDGLPPLDRSDKRD